METNTATLFSDAEAVTFENFSFPVGIYMLQVNNRENRTRWKICSKLTIKIGVFIVNFKRISHLVLVFLLLTLNM